MISLMLRAQLDLYKKDGLMVCLIRLLLKYMITIIKPKYKRMFVDFEEKVPVLFC